jgi:hypothetical protein
VTAVEKEAAGRVGRGARRRRRWRRRDAIRVFAGERADAVTAAAGVQQVTQVKGGPEKWRTRVSSVEDLKAFFVDYVNGSRRHTEH